MTVYVEYVLIDNFIIDYLLLRCAFMISGYQTSKKRLILCSLIASLFSLLFPLINFSAVPLTILKFSFGAFIVSVSGKFVTFKQYLVTLTCFFIVTFLTGGAIIGVYSLIGVKEFSEWMVAFCFIPVYLLSFAFKKFLSYFYKRRTTMSLIYEVEIENEGKTVKTKGFLDTGNSLYDRLDPVIVCEKDLFIKIMGFNDFSKLRKITVNTANGKSDNFCIIIEKIKIFDGSNENIHFNVAVVLASVNIAGCELLIHPALIKGGNYDFSEGKIKKAS